MGYKKKNNFFKISLKPNKKYFFWIFCGLFFQKYKFICKTKNNFCQLFVNRLQIYYIFSTKKINWHFTKLYFSSRKQKMYIISHIKHRWWIWFWKNYERTITIVFFLAKSDKKKEGAPNTYLKKFLVLLEKLFTDVGWFLKGPPPKEAVLRPHVGCIRHAFDIPDNHQVFFLGLFFGHPSVPIGYLWAAHWWPSSLFQLLCQRHPYPVIRL